MMIQKDTENHIRFIYGRWNNPEDEWLYQLIKAKKKFNPYEELEKQKKEDEELAPSEWSEDDSSDVASS